jgi:hypothetical protein
MNKNKPDHSKIFIDNDQRLSTENAAPTDETEVVTQRLIIKGKIRIILARYKASYTQEIGEVEAAPSRWCERLFQCKQMCEPVLGAPAISLEILWTDLE